MAMRLFHRTSVENAGAILKSGFRDGTGKYMTNRKWSGVFLSDIPDAGSEFGGVLLEVTFDMPERELDRYEWKEEGKEYREWLIPALLINSKARVRIAAEE